MDPQATPSKYVPLDLLQTLGSTTKKPATKHRPTASRAKHESALILEALNLSPLSIDDDATAKPLTRTLSKANSGMMAAAARRSSSVPDSLQLVAEDTGDGLQANDQEITQLKSRLKALEQEKAALEAAQAEVTKQFNSQVRILPLIRNSAELTACDRKFC